MLILTLQKKWFDMILSGEKQEEYREIKPYYTSRFCNVVLHNGGHFEKIGKEDLPLGTVKFRNGYAANAPSFLADCLLTIGTGKEAWGAETGRSYYVLKIANVRKE